MRVVVSQLNPKIGDLDGNTRKIIDVMERAREGGNDIVLFPELTISGYLPEDLLFHKGFIDSISQHLEQIMRASKGLMVVVGLPRRNVFQGEKPLLNSAAIIQDGHLMGFQDKWLLPNYDVFQERRYFEPGHHTRTWDYQGKKVAVVICEDIWQHAGYVSYTSYARDPIAELVAYKPDVLLNLSASPYQFQKPDMRVKVCGKAARTLGCPVILCCQVGANDQLLFDGYSIHVSQDGKLCQLAKGFEEDEMVCDLDAPSCNRSLSYDPMNDLYQALVMGVRDYFAKQDFNKALLGLSGGIDSALVACIASDAIGPENVMGVRMPSCFTSEESMVDAQALAANLGMKMETISIKKPFDSFNEELASLFAGKESDVTEENLQARARGVLLMAISNKLGMIVLSTGNKSEMALGYSTLYGDMCGGLGVIGDVTKTQVYDLCRWINEKKGAPIPERIITKPPSAELKPNQIDLDTLPDYGIVDSVLACYVEDYLCPNDIAEKLKVPLEMVIDLIQRIHNAEYKRRQAPPILRVSRKSFGVGRRYPIVQGWA